MSVVVKMGIPKDCPMCPMSHWNKLDELTGCEVAPGKLFEMSRSKEYRESNTRPDWCPILCELPEKHGRLVDMKDIDLMMENASSTSDESGLYSLVYRDDLDFDGLPTIVPAERSEKK